MIPEVDGPVRLQWREEYQENGMVREYIGGNFIACVFERHPQGLCSSIQKILLQRSCLKLYLGTFCMMSSTLYS